MKLDKNCFNFQNNLILCLAYIPSNQSTYATNMQQDLIDLLENDILLYKTKGDIMICGDLNARTGSQQDFISNDGMDHLPLYQNYNFAQTKQRRYCRCLIDICIGNQLRILNGRCYGFGSILVSHQMVAVWLTV